MTPGPDKAGAGGGFDRLLGLLAWAGGVVLVGIVLLTMVDVVLRYAFASPVFGAQDMAELAMLVVVFLAVPYCGRRHGHISVDVFTGLLGPRVLRFTEPLVQLAGAAIVGLLAWRSLVAAADVHASGQESNLLGIPLWPFYALTAAGAALYVVVLLGHAAAAARGRLHGVGSDG